jgi:HD-GYP domain-containing protein (c-di-GMP phosphodiesterase class II)
MTATRPYRKAISADETVAELRARSGTKFDPEVVDALLDLLGHNQPQVPDRSAGVRLAARPPSEPTGRRSRPASAPGE